MITLKFRAFTLASGVVTPGSGAVTLDSGVITWDSVQIADYSADSFRKSSQFRSRILQIFVFISISYLRRFWENSDFSLNLGNSETSQERVRFMLSYSNTVTCFDQW